MGLSTILMGLLEVEQENRSHYKATKRTFTFGRAGRRILLYDINGFSSCLSAKHQPIRPRCVQYTCMCVEWGGWKVGGERLTLTSSVLSASF